MWHYHKIDIHLNGAPFACDDRENIPNNTIPLKELWHSKWLAVIVAAWMEINFILFVFHIILFALIFDFIPFIQGELRQKDIIKDFYKKLQTFHFLFASNKCRYGHFFFFTSTITT